jgi:hypothetical protein
MTKQTVDHAQNLRDLIAKRKAGVVRKTVRQDICMDVELATQYAELKADLDFTVTELKVKAQKAEQAGSGDQRMTSRGPVEDDPKVIELRAKVAQLAPRVKAVSYKVVLQGLSSDQYHEAMALAKAVEDGAKDAPAATDLDRIVCRKAFLRWEDQQGHPVDMPPEQGRDLLHGLLDSMSRGEVQQLANKVTRATLDPMSLSF